MIGKVDLNGNLLWHRVYRDFNEDGSPRFKYLYSLTELSDGSIVAGGNAINEIGNLIDYNGWILKVDENGCLTDDDCENEIVNITTSVKETVETPLLNLYPNPVEVILNVEISTNYQLEKIEIIDSKGMLISQVDSSDSIDTSALSNGIYFLHAISRTGHTAVRHFLKI